VLHRQGMCVTMVKLISVLALSVACLCFFGDCTNAKETLDSKLIGKIRSGHERLKKNLDNVSGSVVRWRGELDRREAEAYFKEDGLAEDLRARFYISQGAVRIEYGISQYAKDHEVIALSPDDDFAEVLVQTQKTGLRYTAVSTTGVPYATLFAYKNPKHQEIEMRINADLKYPLSTSFGLSGTRVLDLMQRSDIELETRPYKSVDKALHIRGRDVSDEGQITTFLVVLEPSRDYTVRSYEFRTETQGIEAVIEGHLRVTEIEKGVFVPSGLVTLVKTTTLEGPSTSGSYREVVHFDIACPDAPLPKDLFSVEGFAAMERDYTIVDVSADDSMQVGKTIEAAPEASRFPGGSSDFSDQSSSRFFWILVNGIVVFLLGAFLLYRKLQTNRSSS